MRRRTSARVEAAAAAAGGALLGAAAGLVVGGPVGAALGALVAGANGMVAGRNGIYDWSSARGWFAFASDSTWALVGTALGTSVLALNRARTGSNYRVRMSRRRNRHVWERGAALKHGFAFTLGNVISNASLGGRGLFPEFIKNHEEFHIWQSRMFGPLFQLTYVVWGAGGAVVAAAVWLARGRQTDGPESLGALVQTACYYDNPFEYWAYRRDGNWPPSGIRRPLLWP